MKEVFSLRLFLYFLLFFPSAFALAEGTKEIEPDGEGNPCKLHLSKYTNPGNASYNNFALYAAGANERLQITIGAVGEVIYFGFKPQPNMSGFPPSPSDPQISCRIKNPGGTVVWGPQVLPWTTGNPGFIDTYNQAFIGPSSLPGGGGGYSALSYTPLAVGDYYIEFDFPGNNVTRTHDFFDITVASATGLKKPGRVWSKAWQFTTDGDNNTTTAILFPYSDDGITTSIDLNGISPYRFAVSCNQTGCNNTGIIENDRKSVEGKHTYPQYRIFLNEPDHTISYFPIGELGILQSATIQSSDCDGNVYFNIVVNKTGQVKLTLNFPSSGYFPREIPANVTGGAAGNLIYWDGKDGIGTSIPNGQQVNISIVYINGLTNLPMYDAEYMNSSTYPVWHGLIVDLVSPAGSKPPLFWDDTQITGCNPPPGSNYAGCLDLAGCHPWNYCIGDENTINTWWYALSTSNLTLTLTFKRYPGNLGPIIGDDMVCQGTAQKTYVVPIDPNSTSYVWTWPAGVTPVSTPPFTNSIILDFTNAITSGNITVCGTNTDCGDGPLSTKPIAVNPLPAVDGPHAKNICSGFNTNVNLTSTPVGASFSWTNPIPACSGNILVCPAGSSGNSINDILTLTNYSTGTVTYMITPTLSGCAGAIQNYVVTVDPLPDVQINSTTPNICSAGTATILLTSSVPGTVLNWTATPSAGTLSGFPLSGSGDIIHTITNSGNTAETVVYAITPVANTCSGSTVTYTVTVNPVPVVVLPNPAEQTVCSNVATSAVVLNTNVIGTPVSYNWTVLCDAGITNCPAGGSAGTIPSVSINNPLFVQQNATYTITAGIGTCLGSPSSYVVHVNPIPDLAINPVTHPDICSGASTGIALTSNVPGVTFDWTATGNASTIAPVPPFSGSGNSISQSLSNSGNILEPVVFSITPSALGCAPPATNYTVNVNPVPAVVLPVPPEQTVCSNVATTAVALSTNVTGTPVSYSWTTLCDAGITNCPSGGVVSTIPSATINNPLFIQQNVNYTITAGIGSCLGTPSAYTIHVNPIPDLAISPVTHPDICSGTSTAIALTSNVSGVTFDWTATGNAATIIPVPPFAGSGNNIGQSLSNSGNIVEPVVFAITPSALGCAPAATNYTVNVNPVPSVICNAGQTICSGNNTLVTPLSSSVASGVNYTWTAVAVPPTLYGFAATGSSLVDIPSEAIYNPEVIQGSVTYTVTAHYGSCVGTTNTHLVLVNPSPTVTPSPINQNTCSAYQSSQQINFTANVSPTTYTWVVDQVAGLNPGYLTNGITDNIPAQTLTVSGALQGFVRYKITPSSQIGMSCPGAPNYATIFVNPLPSPVITGPTLACELGPNVTYSTPDIPGHSYLWTVTGGTITSAPNLNQITVQWGAYTLSPGTLTVAETIDATACVVTTSAYGVVLQQRPVPNLSGPQTVCEGDALKVYVTDGGMSQYDWQINGGSFTSGGTPGSSSATVTWTTPGSDKWIQVNYVNSLGCPGYPAKQIPVLVNPLPNTTILGADVTCESQTYNYNTPPDPSCTNCTYTWSINPPGRGSFTSPQGSPTMGINWVSSGAATVSVVGLNNLTSCTSNHSFNVTINPKPQVTLAFCFDPVTTRNAKEFRLRGGSPVSGVFTGGPAVHLSGGDYFFNPINANTGNNTITYTYTNVYGCPAIATANINVLNLPAFSCGTTLTDVRDPSKTYTTAFIGNKCWMTKNLDYGSIKASGLSQTNNCLVEKYCLPTDANCTAFGGLYQWDELMKYESTEATQGLCPPEWHVPTEAEWIALINSYNGNGLAGAFLKDQFLVPGFKAVLGNILYLNNTWAFPTFSLSMYWSSKSSGASQALSRGLNSFVPSVSLYPSSRANAFPVRCVHD